VRLQSPREDVTVRFAVIGDEDERWFTHDDQPFGSKARTLARSSRGLNGFAT
jgi:hypothetical protein